MMRLLTPCKFYFISSDFLIDVLCVGIFCILIVGFRDVDEVVRLSQLDNNHVVRVGDMGYQDNPMK